MTIIDKILALFGYIKVPKSAIEANLGHEELIKGLLDDEPDNTILKALLENQKKLTHFLQTGRLLQ